MMICNVFICLLCVTIEVVHGDCLKVCEESEYLDEITCSCPRCADLCLPRPDRSTDAECERKCPNYTHWSNVVKNSIRGNHSKSFLINTTTAPGKTPAVVQALDGGSDSLVKNPLFWTSVVSVLISIVATIVLIILCICKKTQPGRRLFGRRSPFHQEAASLPRKEIIKDTESSEGMVHSAEKTYQSGLSDQFSFSGGRHLISLSDHCTADCFAVQPESDTSNCRSFGLKKPSFTDSNFFRTGLGIDDVHLMDEKDTEYCLKLQTVSSSNKRLYEFREDAELQMHMGSITYCKEPVRFTAESGFDDARSSFVPSAVANVSLIGCSVF